MKKFIKKSIFALMFVFAFLFVGVEVSASDRALNNTTLSTSADSYDLNLDGEKYTIISGSAEKKSIILNAESKGETVWHGAVIYDTEISVFKCVNYDEENAVCNTWNIYTFKSPSTKLEALDYMLKDEGLTLSLKNSNFKPAKTNSTVNGVDLSKLTSKYDMSKIYYVAVQYSYQGVFVSDTYKPDMFRIIFTADMEGIKVTHEVNESTKIATVKITSGSPISGVKYFVSDAAVAEGYVPETYNELVTGAEKNPKCENGLFVYTFDINLEDGKHYYVDIEDVADNSTRYSLTNSTQQDDNNPDSDKDDTKNNNVNGNVGNTKVGKIILIVLLVILVLAIILVIVQKIVDYKKKLY